MSESKFGYLLSGPSLLLIFALVAVPIGYAIYLTFFETTINGSTGKFIGFAQYGQVLTDKMFWYSLGITAIFAVVSIVLQLGLGILIALLLNSNFKGRGFMRGIILAPWAVPTIVNAQLWGWIFNASYGVLNKILYHLGWISSPIVWLGTGISAMGSVIVADTWRMTPLYVLMFLAGLQTISGDLYEAAMVDGAGPLKRFRHITLPLLKPIMLVVLVLRTMQALRVFDIIYLMTKGGPNNSTMVISYYSYFKTFSSLDFGYGSTIGLMIAVVTILVSLVYQRVLKDDTYADAAHQHPEDGPHRGAKNHHNR